MSSVSRAPETAPAPTRSAAAEGERLWFLGTLAIVRVPGEAVGDRFSAIEFLLPRYASPPLHTHPQDESYFVLEGELTIVAGEQRFTLQAGGIGAVPIGMPHTFRVDSDSVRLLVLSTPAGLERMVRDGSQPAGAPTLPPPGSWRPTPRELERIFAAHGQVNLGPSLAPGE